MSLYNVLIARKGYMVVVGVLNAYADEPNLSVQLQGLGLLARCLMLVLIHLLHDSSCLEL